MTLYKTSLMCILDLSKAFETVGHSILFLIFKYGIKVSTPDWMRNYFKMPVHVYISSL